MAMSLGRMLGSRTNEARLRLSPHRAAVITVGTVAMAVAAAVLAFYPPN